MEAKFQGPRLVELLFKAVGWLPAERHGTLTEAHLIWNYTTILNIVVLPITAALLWRAIGTGGFKVLAMIPHRRLSVSRVRETFSRRKLLMRRSLRRLMPYVWQRCATTDSVHPSGTSCFRYYRTRLAWGQRYGASCRSATICGIGRSTRASSTLTTDSSRI